MAVRAGWGPFKINPSTGLDRSPSRPTGCRAPVRRSKIADRQRHMVPNPFRAPAELQKSGYARYAGLGIQFAVTVGVFGVFGYWLDTLLGTLPLLLLILVFLGFAGALFSLVRKVPPPTGRKASRSAGARPTEPDDDPTRPNSG